MSLHRRIRRRSAQRLWKSLGEPGEFRDFWQALYSTRQVKIAYRTDGTAHATKRSGLVRRFFNRFRRRIK